MLSSLVCPSVSVSHCLYVSVLCSSHLVTVATGPRLSDALISSPIIVEDGGALPGAGFEFGIDPNEDPELALVSSTLSHTYYADFCVSCHLYEVLQKSKVKWV